MAKVWMHNGFLQVEGQKMSKSLGNFVTIHELLETEKFGGRKWPGDVLKLTMLKSNYRQPIDWTARSLDESFTNLKHLEAIGDFSERVEGGSVDPDLPTEFLDALCDDLNTSRAFSIALELARVDYSPRVERMLEMLGLDMSRFSQENWSHQLPALVNDAVVGSLVAARLEARKAKNWAESDRIRDELAAMGIAIKDKKDGTTSWEIER